MDRIAAMRVFVSVAKLGSFAAAARQLRLSPSGATRSVAQLEDQLGLMLFTRTTRSLRLTERGAIYLESCQQILEDLDGADKRVRGENAEPRGELNVAAPILFGRLHVLPIVNLLLDQHPALAVRLSFSDRNVHLIDDGIDVAVRIGELADSSLIAVKLGLVNRVLVASPSYLKKSGTPKAPKDLAGHRIIAFEGIDAFNEWKFGVDDETIRLSPRLTVNSADAAIAAAEGDNGIARALSYQVRSSVAAGNLVPVLQKYAPPPMPVSAVYPARRIASANVATFVKAARSYFASNPLLPVEEWGVSAKRKSGR